jgi:hypothetical protein
MNEFPAEIIYTNERILISGQTSIPDRNVLVIETGGQADPWTKYTEKTVQILTRDSATPKARKLAWDIFNKITDRFGLQLPVATVDGITYNSIQSAQITAIQEPQSIGADEESRSRFSTNYKIIYNRR